MTGGLGCRLPQPVYGVDALDERHISRFVVPLIIDQFVKHYFSAQPAA